MKKIQFSHLTVFTVAVTSVFFVTVAVVIVAAAVVVAATTTASFIVIVDVVVVNLTVDVRHFFLTAYVTLMMASMTLMII